MLRFLSTLACAGLLLASQPLARGFVLLGPIGGGADDYQAGEISYALAGDIGAPKNLGEEYRLNTPSIFWGADSSFLDYFGKRGLSEIEKAFEVFNNLNPVSSYSRELNEFPLDSQQINYTAQAFNLADIKSTLMGYLLEHMGLAEPDRWTWALRYRVPLGIPCFYEYGVIMRNYDPVTWEYTRYVNGASYSYVITENCAQADAVEVPLDQLATTESALAALALNAGGFYTTLTRDDMGGLRYLYRTNNMNVEVPATGVELYQTNVQPELLYSSNLTQLASLALTNDAAGLQGFYPGLNIVATSNYFRNVWVTNVTTYTTNYPFDPVGTPPHVVNLTNRYLTVATYYRHLFDNLNVVVYTNGVWTVVPVTDIDTIRGRQWFDLVTSTLVVSPYSSAISNVVYTNITSKTVLSNNIIAGDFFILPTNACDVKILSQQLVTVTNLTNIVYQNTNLFFSTNLVGGSNLVTQVIEESVVQWVTNRIFIAQIVNCITNNAELRQGIEKVSYFRRDYDSLLGRFFQPITNNYTMNAIIRNQRVEQRFRRVITAPDILIQAEDLVGPGVPGLQVARGINFGGTNLVGNLAGPGTIEPATTFTFNKVGPLKVNNTLFADEVTALSTNFLWASFDASTNAPVVYPDQASILDLENQVVIDVTPAPPTLPDAVVGIEYGDLFSGFTVSGGEGPYTWTALAALPNGMYLSPGGTQGETCDLFGAPSYSGTKTIQIRVTDAFGRFVDLSYSLKIKP